MISAGSDGQIIVWTLRRHCEKFRLVANNSAVNALAYADLSENILSAGEDKTIRVWSMKTRSQVRVIDLSSNFVLTIAVTSECRYVAFAGEDVNINLWEPTEETQGMKTLRGHSSYITTAKMGSNDRTMVSAGRDKTIRVWDIVEGTQVGCFTGHVDTINCVEITWDCRKIISAGLDRNLKIWNIENGNEEIGMDCHTDWVISVAINRHRNVIATGSLDKSIKLWRLNQKRSISSLLGHKGEVKLIGKNFENNLISVGTESAVIIWDITRKSIKNKFEIPSQEIEEAILIDNEDTFVTRESNQKVTVWTFHDNIIEKLTVCNFQEPVKGKKLGVIMPTARFLTSAVNICAFFGADKNTLIGFWKITTDEWKQSAVSTEEDIREYAVCKNCRVMVSSSKSLMKVSVWKIKRPEL